jgi:C4-dicarboxylate-specific signal transduction histidine kinase
MRDETRYRYLSDNSDWTRELVLAFAGGFLLASFLWIGLWYFQARPTQADALQEKESAVQELENRIEQCLAEKRRAEQAGEHLEAEVAQLDRQLKQAWAAAGRCAR